MSLTDPQVSGLIDQLEALKSTVPKDEASRYKVSVALRELSLAIETPLDTVRRLAFSVNEPLSEGFLQY